MVTRDGLGFPPQPTHHDAQPLQAVQPYATRLSLAHRPELAATLWMGGTQSALGSPIAHRELARAVVIDCAGELPDGYRRSAALYVPCVFTDLEAPPARLAAIEALVADLAGRIRGAVSPSAPEPLERVYLLCQAGMNRSGLLAGLLLRALGEDADAAIDGIRRLRPGALSNQTFEALIRAWTPP